ncbi:NADAR domain-containing protein [Balamuthia mandrillaris]
MEAGKGGDARGMVLAGQRDMNSRSTWSSAKTGNPMTTGGGTPNDSVARATAIEQDQPDDQSRKLVGSARVARNRQVYTLGEHANTKAAPWLRAYTKETKQEIRFSVIDGEYGCFSTFAPMPFTLHDKEWLCCEQYVHAKKFVGHELEEQIRQTSFPLDFIRLSHSRSETAEDYAKQAERLMEEACMAKFRQHPAAREKLLNTKDTRLVYETSADDYWGQGSNQRGRNVLGGVLMRVRSNLRAEIDAAVKQSSSLQPSATRTRALSEAPAAQTTTKVAMLVATSTAAGAAAGQEGTIPAPTRRKSSASFGGTSRPPEVVAVAEHHQRQEQAPSKSATAIEGKGDTDKTAHQPQPQNAPIHQLRNGIEIASVTPSTPITPSISGETAPNGKTFSSSFSAEFSPILKNGVKEGTARTTSGSTELSSDSVTSEDGGGSGGRSSGGSRSASSSPSSSGSMPALRIKSLREFWTCPQNFRTVEEKAKTQGQLATTSSSLLQPSTSPPRPKSQFHLAQPDQSERLNRHPQKDRRSLTFDAAMDKGRHNAAATISISKASPAASTSNSVSTAKSSSDRSGGTSSAKFSETLLKFQRRQKTIS